MKKNVYKCFIHHEVYTIESDQILDPLTVGESFVKLINNDKYCPYIAGFDGENLIFRLPIIKTIQPLAEDD